METIYLRKYHNSTSQVEFLPLGGSIDKLFNARLTFRSFTSASNLHPLSPSRKILSLSTLPLFKIKLIKKSFWHEHLSRKSHHQIIFFSYSLYNVLLTTSLMNKSACCGEKCTLLNVNTASYNRNMTLIHFCAHSSLLILLYSLYNI